MNQAMINAMQNDIAQLQTLVIGNSSIPGSGLRDRVRELEIGDKSTQEKLTGIQTTLNRVAWIMVTGVIVALMNLIMPRPMTPASSTQTTSIQTSAAPSIGSSSSQKSYLTVADLSEREVKSARTIQLWASEGRIVGASKTSGGDWTFSKDYRIIPPNDAQLTAVPTKP